MAMLHCVAAWPVPPAPPCPDVVGPTLRASGQPSRAELLQRPRRCRQTDLQDFAARFAEESPLPFVIYWEALTSPPAHVLLTQVPDGSWQAHVCTDEELAHWLHALGMYIRATQRQHRRQAHCQGHPGAQVPARDLRPLSPPLAYR
jgi:hypothetical protein